MALGDPYVTSDELADYLSTSNAGDFDLAGLAVESASQSINEWCGRQFNKIAEDDDPTERIFDRVGPILWVDDFWSLTDLVVEDEYGTVWDTANYTVLPRGGVVNGVPGWPYTRFDSTTYSSCCEITVTARWGWAAVPDPVRHACLILAAERFKLKEAPSGVAGFNDFGPVRVREMPQVETMLAPYRIRSFVA